MSHDSETPTGAISSRETARLLTEWCRLTRRRRRPQMPYVDGSAADASRRLAAAYVVLGRTAADAKMLAARYLSLMHKASAKALSVKQITEPSR